MFTRITKRHSQRLFWTILLLVSTYTSSEAACPDSELTLTTQQEIDNFATNYPNCTILNELLRLKGEGISNLNGLSSIERINSVLSISETAITNMSGLGNLTYVSDLYILSNDNVNSLNGLGNLTITKVLWIGGNQTLTTLNGLNSLMSVTRKFNIFNNASLINLAGLQSLKTVGSGSTVDYLSISDNDNLRNLGGLNNLKNVRGRLSIYNNAQLESLTGLFRLEIVEEEFIIRENDMLTDIGDLSTLTDCPELTIENNATLPNLQGMSLSPNAKIVKLEIIDNPMMTSMLGFGSPDVDAIFIKNNNSLLNLTGMEGMTNVNKIFEISNNDALMNMQGLNNLANVGDGLISLAEGISPRFVIRRNVGLLNLSGLDALSSVDGNFVIVENGLTDLTGLNAPSLFTRRLRILDNPNLISLDGIPDLLNVETSFQIEDNPLLHLCYADGVCRMLDTNPNVVQFSNNATGCNTRTQVQNLCDCASETQTGGECPTDCEGTLNGMLMPGSPCEDGDTNTADDMYQIDCTCAGTPMPECSDTFILEFPANH